MFKNLKGNFYEKVKKKEIFRIYQLFYVFLQVFIGAIRIRNNFLNQMSIQNVLI